MNSTIVSIIGAVLASNALFGFIQFIITRKDNRFKKAMTRLERDVLRTQLLVMVVLKPDESQEILTLAEHYFKDLKGDWYMTSIFYKWLLESEIAEPEWFDHKS